MTILKKRVAVIGAGSAGLVCTKILSDFNSTESDIQFEVVCFEAGSQVGGQWIYLPPDDKEGLGNIKDYGSIYESLTTNLTKYQMSYSHFPMFQSSEHSTSNYQDFSLFPSHAQISNVEKVEKYLQDYAKGFDLLSKIRFNTRVVEVQCQTIEGSTDPVYNCNWAVTSRPSREQSHEEKDGHELLTEQFDAVVACSGRYWLEYIPSFPGLEEYQGEIVHSHVYRRPDWFKGKRVLSVGYGASGKQITEEIAKRGNPKTPVYHSVSPNHHATTDDPNIKIVGDISEIIPGTKSVRFRSGEEEEFDVILFSTGYDYYFPYLKTSNWDIPNPGTNVSVEIVEKGKNIHREGSLDEWRNLDDISPSCLLKISHSPREVFPVYGHTVHMKYPTLCVLGLPYQINPFPLFEWQAVWMSHIWSGMTQLPTAEEMQKSVSLFRKETEAVQTERKSRIVSIHALDAQKQKDYYQFIQKQTGDAVQRPWSGKQRSHYKKEIVQAKARHVDVENYKADQLSSY
ncbi:putative flavin dependent monooxygenase [Planoprotostelium fungivorum]|uniref:Putative flavin dependent monooxygenase n=1 Tax=Planoprotostelium fungivorum TaxID=1890364 RepID=A0A2P6N780_9EUKA|nr:putative flavin dependent monooxygenase [Planoprotostelium fungivorum]